LAGFLSLPFLDFLEDIAGICLFTLSGASSHDVQGQEPLSNPDNDTAGKISRSQSNHPQPKDRARHKRISRLV
jgi:hypothetical protein